MSEVLLAVWVGLSTYAAVAGLTFLATYLVLVGAPRSTIGWNVVALSGAVTLAFSAIAFRAWVGRPIHAGVWISISAVIGVALTVQTALLIRENRRARAEEAQLGSHR